jgi:ornithine carbamoyltransferase
MKRDYLSFLDLNAKELEGLISKAIALKRQRGAVTAAHGPLRSKTLAMIFEKASTRTRLSFEVGMIDLGGNAIFLNPKDMQLGRGEEVRDTARVLSRYVAAVMIRSFSHATVTEFARWASVPVINGLSDREHPCQLLADILTLREHFGPRKSLKIGWIGDGNNVCNSLVLSSALTGMEVAVACPPGYLPDAANVALAKEMGGRVRIASSPMDAAEGADALYTDVWVSMGDEAQREARLQAFRGYTITTELVDHAAGDAVVLHCLPAHRGEEITDEVIEGPRSLVWDQAENRLHAQKALLLKLLGGS